MDEVPHASVGESHLVGLGGEREVDGTLAEREVTLGNADEVAGVEAGGSHQHRLRVGEPHVLGGDHQQAPCDEERVLARLQHARDPVDGCLRVAAPLRETKRPLPR